MSRLLFTVFIGLSALLFVDCSGSRALSNRALELEEAGLTREAADFYYMALQRDPRNVDARIGLKKTGKEVLEEELDEFFKANSAEDHKQAVYSYLDAKEYMEKCNVFVDMSISSYHQNMYEESLAIYLTERYNHAEELMYQEKYEEADSVYREIVDLDPDFKDAQELLKLSKVEPLYQKGVRAYEGRNYRESYLLMKRIIDSKGSYKDAVDYKQRALDKAVQTVAVTDIKTKSEEERLLAAKLKGNMISNLVSSDNPFIKVVDRSNTDRILEEQRINMTVGAGRDTRVQAGEMLGADILITGEILSFTVEGGSIDSYTKPAYKQVQVRKKNPRTGEYYRATSSKRTSYKEYYGEKAMKCKIQIQVINAQTGEIASAEVFDEQMIDRVNYASYNGDPSHLTPAPESSDSFAEALEKAFSGSSRREFMTKFSSKHRKFASNDELRASLANNISKKMIQQIEKLNAP